MPPADKTDHPATARWRTLLRTEGTSVWLPGNPLKFRIGRDGPVPLAYLNWGAEDGTKWSVTFADGDTQFRGSRRDPDGSVQELRGDRQLRAPMPDLMHGQVPWSETGWTFSVEMTSEDGPGVPAGRWNLLLDDGGGAPLVFIAWLDRDGSSGSLNFSPPTAREAVIDGLTLSVSAEQAEAGEVGSNLLDDSPSKWFAAAPTAALDLTPDRGVKVTGYELVSADDAPDRDPQDWTLFGTSVTNAPPPDACDFWDVLDSRAGQVFAGRYEAKKYSVTAPDLYFRYRLEVTANAGSPHLQLSALRLLRRSEPHPDMMTGWYRPAGAAVTSLRGVSVSRAVDGADTPDTAETADRGEARATPPERSTPGPGLDQAAEDDENGRPVPATVDEWTDYLRSYSDDYLRTEDPEEIDEYSLLTQVQRDQRWLGFEPASEDQILAVERRLEVRLPPSYRTFLLASNGWHEIAPFVSVLRSVEHVGWLRDVEKELYDAWASFEDLADINHLIGRSLAIGYGDNGDYWFLDPTQVSADGEWTAYSWHPSDGEPPDPEPSFAALVADARSTFERFREGDGRPVAAAP